jgi:hypothetical protein
MYRVHTKNDYFDLKPPTNSEEYPISFNNNIVMVTCRDQRGGGPKVPLFPELLNY